jgi:hypothetical protein
MDEISDISTIHDLTSYAHSCLHQVLGDFLDAQRLDQLVKKSDRLFQWIYLACEYITKKGKGGITAEEKFDDLCSPFNQGLGDALLDSMYYIILKDLFDIENPRVRARFQSIMSQILATMEPLPRSALNAMRIYFPELSNKEKDVGIIIDNMGSLLTGSIESSIPIRPVHLSFSEFLTNKEASKEFYIDISKAQEALAFSALKVLVAKDGLQFNIAQIPSSYLKNSELDKNILSTIPAHLVYSSKFWTNHLNHLQSNSESLKMIHSLLFERFLFLLEVLTLAGALNTCMKSLTNIKLWVQVCHVWIK